MIIIIGAAADEDIEFAHAPMLFIFSLIGNRCVGVNVSGSVSVFRALQLVGAASLFFSCVVSVFVVLCCICICVCVCICICVYACTATQLCTISANATAAATRRRCAVGFAYRRQMCRIHYCNEAHLILLLICLESTVNICILLGGRQSCLKKLD